MTVELIDRGICSKECYIQSIKSEAGPKALKISAVDNGVANWIKPAAT